MKKSKSILLVLLSAVFALCVFAFTACTPEPEGGGDGEVKITIAPATLSLAVGGAAADVTATVENSEEKVTWSSNKPNIATVAADATDGNKAKVSAVAAGDAVITAKIGDKTAVCRVTVTGGGGQGGDTPGGDEQKVNVALDKSYLTLSVDGAAGTLNATVTGSSDTVTWAVDKSDVATITPNGNSVTVTPVAAGTAKVTATLGDITRTCNVTVEGKAVLPEITTWEEVADPIYGEVHENDNDYIFHHLFLNDAVAKAYDFDGYEATVTLDGAPGEVVTANPMVAGDITAHTYHLHIRVKGNRYQTAVISVKFKKGENVVATGTYTRNGDKELVLDSVKETVSKGDSATISVTSVNGKTDLTGLEISWAIADTEGTGVATIPDESTGSSVVVTAVNEGKATLTCTVGKDAAAITKTCEITVVEGEVVITAVDVSSQYNFNNKFEASGNAIQVYYNLQDAKYADLVAQIDPSKTEVTVTMDGEESTGDILRKEWQAVGTYSLWVQIRVASDWSHSYVFRFSFKNAKGVEVAYATHTEAPPDKLEISSSITIKLAEENAENTADVTAEIGGSVKAEDIVWSISGDGTVATIPDESKGGSVTVTGKLKGEVTLTATYVTADNKTLTAECTVTVINHDEQEVVKDPFIRIEADAEDIFEYYGAYYVKIKLDNENVTNNTDMTLDKVKEKYAWSETWSVNDDGTANAKLFDTGHHEIFSHGPATSGNACSIFVLNAQPTNGTTYMLIGYDAQNGNKLIEIVFTYNNSNAA